MTKKTEPFDVREPPYDRNGRRATTSYFVQDGHPDDLETSELYRNEKGHFAVGLVLLLTIFAVGAVFYWAARWLVSAIVL